MTGSVPRPVRDSGVARRTPDTLVRVAAAGGDHTVWLLGVVGLGLCGVVAWLCWRWYRRVTSPYVVLLE